MKSTEKLTRHQILLYEGDFDKLNDIYRRRSATEVVRLLVRRHLHDIEERYQKRFQQRDRLSAEESLDVG